MRRTRILSIGVAVLAVLAMAFSVAVLADFGDEDPVHGELEGPGGSLEPEPCYCPAIYDPVACRVGDEWRIFSNACVAACNGATRCVSFDTPGD